MRLAYANLKTALSGTANLGLTTPFLFVVLYLIANIAYFYMHLYSIIGTVPASLITAPFNSGEDISKIYVSVWEGTLNNYLIVVLLLWTSEIYLRHFSKKLKLITPMHVFVSSVVATYLLAIILLIVNGTLSWGSSIIGFSATSILLLGVILDYKSTWKTAIVNVKSNFVKSYVYFVLPGISLFVFLLIFFSYLLQNISWLNHVLGGMIFFILISVSLKLQNIK